VTSLSSQLHFGWFLETGFSPQGWLESGHRIDRDQTKPDLYQEGVRELERAKFDIVVIQDNLVVPETFRGNAEANLRLAEDIPKHDPFPLIPYLLAVTEHIGIAATISSTFYPPFLAARMLATLQHFSPRVGYNVVTSVGDGVAQNFGLAQHLEHDSRYDMADEWVKVVRALWQSWEPDAVVADPDTGVYADYRKVKPINHVGEHFSVRGPLTTEPMPDGEPVLVQAGSSSRGRRFAGENADLVVGFAPTARHMKAYRDEVRDAAAAKGRNPDDVKVFFIVAPHVAESDDDVAALRERIATLTPERIDDALAHMSMLAGKDLGQFELDEPLQRPTSNAVRGTWEAILSTAPPGSTLRDLLESRAKTASETMVGTGREVAEEMQTLAEETGADGLLLRGSFWPEKVKSITEFLVPELRKAGMIRTSYSSGRLRDNLKLF
jgi:FMN-dependent oxidoreductase (nitrilotriacetate monooxygenase family)